MNAEQSIESMKLGEQITNWDGSIIYQMCHGDKIVVLSDCIGNITAHVTNILSIEDFIKQSEYLCLNKSSFKIYEEN